MENAFLIERNINDGSGSITWDPPFEEVFRARLSAGVLSEDQLLPLKAGQSVITGTLVNGRVPDVMGLYEGPFVIAPALREFLNRIEPGVHRFFPVNVRTPRPVNGQQNHGTHWLLFPPIRIDCLDFDQTTFLNDIRGKHWPRTRHSGDPWGAGFPSSMTSLGDPTRRFSIKASLVAGRHLWRVATGISPAYSQYACSPDLWEFFAGNKMIGWKIDLNLVVVS